MQVKNLKEKIDEAKLLVFDFDGTIINLKCEWDRLRKELQLLCIKEYGLNIDFSSLNEGIMQIMTKLPKRALKRAYSVIGRYELRGVHEATQISHAVNFIKNYKHKNKAILSTNTKKAIIAALKKFKIKSYFNLIVAKEDVINQKPHPEGLEFIMSFFKTGPKETIFIGDKDIDFKLGKSAKVKTFDVKDLITL